jgi:predicted O-methyltransferase YrrM
MVPIDEKVIDYVRKVSVRESGVLAELHAATKRRPRAGMMTEPEQTQFLTLLLQTMGAKRVCEVGTFTGYSTLAMAQALPAHGLVVACDVDEDAPALGRKYWKEAGVDHKISLRIGPAADTMRGLLKEFGPGSFDFVYVDADKDNYDTYYELGLELVRTGGIIGLDNVIWGGWVVDETQNDPDTLALRALNKKLHRDERVTVSLLTIGDGLTLALKRP